MTARSYATPFSNASDADFRAWVTELFNELVAAGLTQTADTGQINLASVVRGAASTAAGYHIFRFADALQATKPVFIKIEYGSGSTVATMPGLWVTTGTGTNGAGTITGQLTTRVTWHLNNIQPTLRPLLTNICVKDGYLMVAFKRNPLLAASSPDCGGFMMIARTVDDTGVNNGDGIFQFNAQTGINTGALLQCLGFALPFTQAGNLAYTYMPSGLLNTQVTSTTMQLVKCFGNFPTVRPCGYLAMYVSPEIPENSTFAAALVGATSRNMLALGLTASFLGTTSNATRCAAVVFD